MYSKREPRFDLLHLLTSSARIKFDLNIGNPFAIGSTRASIMIDVMWHSLLWINSYNRKFQYVNDIDQDKIFYN